METKTLPTFKQLRKTTLSDGIPTAEIEVCLPRTFDHAQGYLVADVSASAKTRIPIPGTEYGIRVVYDVRYAYVSDIPRGCSRRQDGYGNRLPTGLVAHVHGRWRRIWASCWGNSALYFVDLSRNEQELTLARFGFAKKIVVIRGIAG